MNIQEVKKMVLEAAQEANCTEIKMISVMQSHCAKAKDEDTLGMLIEIKRDFI